MDWDLSHYPLLWSSLFQLYGTTSCLAPSVLESCLVPVLRRTEVEYVRTSVYNVRLKRLSVVGSSRQQGLTASSWGDLPTVAAS